jgi:outer membrane protein
MMFVGISLFAFVGRIAGAQQRATVPISRKSLADSVTAPLTLEDALREARAANAQLPVAALEVDIARASVREAKAARSPTVGIVSSINAGGPLAYTTSQGAAQVVGEASILDGGLRRANINAANYRLVGAGAGFRVAQKDLDLAVRLQFSEFLRAQTEIEFRQQGLERLKTYTSQIAARRAAGQPIGSDLLSTQVRVGTDEAALEDAARALDEARLQLNNLMGRDPEQPLSLAPLTIPESPSTFEPAAWLTTPDVRAAEANTAAARAAIAAAESERKPQVQVSANVGALPVFGSDSGTGPNSGTGIGGAVLLSLSWPFYDGGVVRARVDRAKLEAQQALDSEIVVKKQMRLSSSFAAAQLTRLFQQIETWRRTIPNARDAYLQTQSMYAGGVATALEVLDAYSAWVDANQAYADAVNRYRQAEANYIRWGSQ